CCAMEPASRVCRPSARSTCLACTWTGPSWEPEWGPRSCSAVWRKGSLYLAQQPPKQWKRGSWREGSKGEQSSRFAAVRVHTAERHVHGAPPSEPVWLLVQWPAGERAPTKYAVCSLPQNTPLKQMVRLWKLRWRVERDYAVLARATGAELELSDARAPPGRTEAVRRTPPGPSRTRRPWLPSWSAPPARTGAVGRAFLHRLSLLGRADMLQRRTGAVTRSSSLD
ncbi:hypothetical protein SAMN05443639_1401, partial [Stigmatella erecta]